MPFRRWLKESIKEAELLYLYNEAVRGTSDIETIKAGVKMAVLKSVKVELTVKWMIEKLIDRVREERQAALDSYDSILDELSDILSEVGDDV